MYEVDALDTVVESAEAPQPDAGAPLPIVVCDEHHLLLAYAVSFSCASWDGNQITMMSPEWGGMTIACVQFKWPLAHMFGPPNDEAFSGHPLADRGLELYAVSEVHNSSWIRKLERMNSVHRSHNRERFLEGLRHFIFAFHDSTFECVAHGIEVEMLRGSMRSALTHMTALLAEKPG